MIKKVIKITLITLVGLFLIVEVGIRIYNYNIYGKYDIDEAKYPHAVGYINQSKALYNNTYELCDEDAIYDIHSPRHLKVFKNSKKSFRENVSSNFDSSLYSDSGYVTFRFIVNCKGEPGWFNIYQTNLNYEEIALNESLVSDLLDFTKNPDNWNVRVIGTKTVDYYMYVTYRIENGKITEILP
ncbi:hypothetical protein [Dokdonia sp. LLG6352-1]|uniref:hypothetical protein n=1 Tax=Dokdonia sp. LLG6352-1 TaxID=3160831 RepID=UPI0038648F55